MQFLLLDRNPPPSNFGVPVRRPFGPRLTLAIQVLGLLATGWVVWLTSVSPRLHRYTWRSLVTHALTYAVLTWAWSAAITFGLYVAVPRRDRGDVVAATLRVSTAAVWFAPAIILLTQLSPAALAASLALVVSATRLLYSQWRKIEPLEEQVPIRVEPAGLFGEREAPPLFVRELAPALAVAFCAQSGVMAILARLPLLAGIFLAAGTALLTVYAISSGVAEADSRRTLPQAFFGVILTVLLASGLTVGGLSGRVIHRPQLAWDTDSTRRPGLVDNLRAVLRQLFYGEQPPGLAKMPAAEESPQADDAGEPDALPPAGAFPEGCFPGVILLPEVRGVPLLVEPSFFLGRGLTNRPIGIPFDGEYWFFRQRYRRPPPNSYRRKGTPAALSFSTTDHNPLEMEAHQKFDQPVDLSCCRTVRVQIWNADRYPGTVWLDFFAMNSTDPLVRSLYLGGAPIKSVPDLSQDHVVAVPEVLEFPIPPDAFHNCIEFALVFRRDLSRADKSARIAIDRFVLVP